MPDVLNTLTEVLALLGAAAPFSLLLISITCVAVMFAEARREQRRERQLRSSQMFGRWDAAGHAASEPGRPGAVLFPGATRKSSQAADQVLKGLVCGVFAGEALFYLWP